MQVLLKQILENGESIMPCELASYKTLCLNTWIYIRKEIWFILVEGLKT